MFAGMHGPVFVTSRGSCWSPPFGFPIPSLAFGLDMVVFQVRRIVLVLCSSYKSLALGQDAQWGLSDDLCADCPEGYVLE